jgi:hypothetical protein
LKQLTSEVDAASGHGLSISEGKILEAGRKKGKEDNKGITMDLLSDIRAQDKLTPCKIDD